MNIGQAKRDLIHKTQAATRDPDETAKVLGVNRKTVDLVLRANGTASTPTPPKVEAKVEVRGRKRRAPRRVTRHASRAVIDLGGEVLALHQLGAIEDRSDEAGVVDLQITDRGRRWANILAHLV